MLWRTTALCLLLAAMGGSALLHVTREVRERERTYARLQANISHARESAHVLRAEWAYLNRLDRVRELSTAHLGMAPTPPERIVRLETLPMRPAKPTPDQVAELPARERLMVRLEGGTAR